MFEIDFFYVFYGSYILSMLLVIIYCIKKYSYDKALTIDMVLLLSTVPTCIWILLLTYWIFDINIFISLVLTFLTFACLRYIASKPIINFKWIKNKLSGENIKKEINKKKQ